MFILVVAIALGAYLIGSLPSGHLVGRLKGVDRVPEGSGNIGATNALRVLGKKWGYLVFVADFLKGFIAVRIGFLAASRLPRNGRAYRGNRRGRLRHGRTHFSRLARIQRWERHCHFGRDYAWAFPSMGFPQRSRGLGRFLLRHALCFRGIDRGSCLATCVQTAFSCFLADATGAW